jgi:hypothetical protein
MYICEAPGAYGSHLRMNLLLSGLEGPLAYLSEIVGNSHMLDGTVVMIYHVNN